MDNSASDREDAVLTWGVTPPALIAAGVVAALGLGWAVLTAESADRLVALAVLVMGLAALAAGWRMRRRLIAGPDGLQVNGPLSSRTIAWTSVVSIEVVRRQRFGIASSTVEIDLDDEGLVVLGRTDLGADPADVARELRTLQPR